MGVDNIAYVSTMATTSKDDLVAETCNTQKLKYMKPLPSQKSTSDTDFGLSYYPQVWCAVLLSELTCYYNVTTLWCWSWRMGQPKLLSRGIFSLVVQRNGNIVEHTLPWVIASWKQQNAWFFTWLEGLSHCYCVHFPCLLSQCEFHRSAGMGAETQRGACPKHDIDISS